MQRMVDTHFADMDSGHDAGMDEHASSENFRHVELSANQTLPVRISARLPAEILLMVFRHALPPSWLLSDMARPSLAPFPQSVWSAELRVKLAVVGVCRTWHLIGLELLYERITLRRLPQLQHLLSTLESRNGLGNLVRSLDIDCLVPRGFYQSHEPKMKRIFQLCPRLSHFGFAPANDPSVRREYIAAQPILLGISDSITSLSFNVESTFAFDNLEDLHLIGKSNFMFQGPPMEWVMPRLCRVWLRATNGFFNNHLPPHTFFAAYGGMITFLSVFKFTPDSDSDTRLQKLLDSCPALEHLAMDASQCTDRPLTHQTIVWVDVFCFVDHHTPVTFESLRAGFPSLRTFRTLDETMNTLGDIPAILPSTGVLEVDDGGAESAWITAVLSTDTNSDDASDDDYAPDAGPGDESSVDNDSDDAGSGSEDADSMPSQPPSFEDDEDGSKFNEYYASYRWINHYIYT
ncbi:hypothetical protein C8R44DRAFT_760809 [Mycena epipterygia]|nr:hypothetical protein C8R44DRAFT_760809 [Mycena epipterygia]